MIPKCLSVKLWKLHIITHFWGYSLVVTVFLEDHSQCIRAIQIIDCDPISLSKWLYFPGHLSYKRLQYRIPQRDHVTTLLKKPHRILVSICVPSSLFLSRKMLHSRMQICWISRSYTLLYISKYFTEKNLKDACLIVASSRRSVTNQVNASLPRSRF